MTRILAVFFILIFAPLSFAQMSVIDGILIQADTTEGFTDRDQFLLKGNVQVAFQGQSLKCDEALVDIKNKMIVAKGNVILNDPQVHLEADSIELNYQTNTGTIENGFIQSGQLVIEGKKINKTGERTYIAEKAEFTSCSTCPPGWSFSGRRIEAELGGYAKIQFPIFKIAGWSAIPLPYLIVPLKTDRQSGLLVPSYEYTQRGRLAFSESFFWAISRSQDATITATYHELLGLKWASEYRYVLSEDSKGSLEGAYIKDKLFSNEILKEYKNTANAGRWHLKYQHHYDLPESFVQRLNFTDVSDLDYLRDFPNDLLEWGDPALENRVSLTKNEDTVHYSAEAMVFKNLLQSYPLADNSDAVHKMPELQIKTSEISLWEAGPSINFNINSTHFVREKFGYDDLSASTDSKGNPIRIPISGADPGEYVRDGSFDPSAQDLMRTGHRLDLSSRIHAPFQLGQYLQLSPSLTYREMQYQFQLEEEKNLSDFSPSAAQRYVQTDLSVRSELSHVYGSDGEFQEKYKHSIIPEVSYSHIPWIRRPNHPFFGNFAGQRYNRSFEPISDQDLNGVNKVQFDYNDRVFDKDLVTFSLSNKVVHKSFSAGNPVYNNLFQFDLSQFYDLNENKNDNPQPWSDILATLNINAKYISADSSTSFNPYAKVTNTSTRFRYKITENNFAQLSYSRNILVNQNNVALTDTKTENTGLGVGWVSRYWDMVANLDYSLVTEELQSWDYITRIKPPGNCWYIELMHKQILGGDVNFKANVSFNFDGI